MNPAGDARGTSEYRTHVGGIMVMRALQRAASHCGLRGEHDGKDPCEKMVVNGTKVEGLVEPARCSSTSSANNCF